MSPIGRIRSALADSHGLARLVYRDSERVAERLELHAMGRLGPQSLEWVDVIRQSRPGDPPALIAQELRGESARLARIDGAIAGSVSISPLSRRISGFYGRQRACRGAPPRCTGTIHASCIPPQSDSRRGVHPTIDSAEPALRTVSAVPMPEKPAQRRSLRTWIHSIHAILIFGGFTSPPSGKPKQAGFGYRRRAALTLVIGVAVWAITCSPS